MNPLLLQMLTERMGGGGEGNPALLQMISQMNQPEGNREELLNTINSQLGADNPMAAMLAQQFADAQRSHKQPTVIDVSPEPDFDEEGRESRRTRERWEESDRAMAELRAQVESMYAELSSLRDRIDTLAAALGACCLCWGRDSRCRNCRGRGTPGFSQPDETLFDEYVLPAIRTLRARQVKYGATTSTKQTQAS